MITISNSSSQARAYRLYAPNLETQRPVKVLEHSQVDHFGVDIFITNLLGQQFLLNK